MTTRPLDRSGSSGWTAGPRAESQVETLAERLTPLLVAQARMRLPPALEDLAPDLVHDVWLAELPAIPPTFSADRAFPGRLLRRLSTAVLRAVNDTVRTHLAGRSAGHHEPGVSRAWDDTASVATRVGRSEVARQVFTALADLDDVSRTIVVLRVVEQMPNGEVAARLGLTDGAASRRYQKGIERLRDLLGAAWLHDA